MTVGHVMSDPRTTQIEYTFSSFVSVFSHIVYVWLDRLLAVRSTLLADINSADCATDASNTKDKRDLTSLSNNRMSMLVILIGLYDAA